MERLDLDVVLAVRIRLEDLEIDDTTMAGGAIAIELPTLGRSVTHELRLHTADGELLDLSGPYPLVERMEMRMEINGAKQAPIVMGITDPPPELAARIKRREEIESELEATIESRAQTRILADRKATIEHLTEHLKRARGELLVMDRYFGQDKNDWRLLDGVQVGVRVLTGKLAKDADGEICKARLGIGVEARYRPKAPIHDRIYVWEGGGVSIGGSPTSFGQAPLRLSRLASAEAELWRAEFEALWQSPHFAPVPRRDEARAE